MRLPLAHDDARGAFALVSPSVKDSFGTRQQDGSWRTNGCHLVQSARAISA